MTCPAPMLDLSLLKLNVSLSVRFLIKIEPSHFIVNGIDSVCNAGVCYAKDGKDLCAIFGVSCRVSAPTTTSTTTPAPQSQLSCHNPCNLGFVLDTIRGQVSTNLVNVYGGQCLMSDNNIIISKQSGVFPPPAT